MSARISWWFGLVAGAVLTVGCGKDDGFTREDGQALFEGREIKFQSTYVYFPSDFSLSIVRDTMPQDEVCAILKRYSESTIESYTKALVVFFQFFNHKPIEEISNRDVVVFNNEYVLTQPTPELLATCATRRLLTMELVKTVMPTGPCAPAALCASVSLPTTSALLASSLSASLRAKSSMRTSRSTPAPSSPLSICTGPRLTGQVPVLRVPCGFLSCTTYRQIG